MLGQPRINNSYILLIIFLVLVPLLPCQSQVTGSGLNICDRLIAGHEKNNQSLVQNLLKDIEKESYIECILQLTPKYFWAQNMTHFMAKFEFLNSADTSACDQVLSIKKDINHTQFALSLICLQSSRILRYRLKVRTFMPMNHHHSVWKTSQQNTIILECLKSPSPYFWKTLYLTDHIPVRRPRIWWKMMEKYRQDIGNFIYDLEVGDEEDDISGYVRSRKKVKKTRWSREYNPDSNKYLVTSHFMQYCNQNNPFQLGSWL